MAHEARARRYRHAQAALLAGALGFHKVDQELIRGAGLEGMLLARRPLPARQLACAVLDGFVARDTGWIAFASFAGSDLA